VIKFQNTKTNRKALTEAGYKIYDPHATFNRKSWIIIGDDDMLYGVDRRNFVVVTAEEYLESQDETTY
jgi:hypothetical protein